MILLETLGAQADTQIALERTRMPADAPTGRARGKQRPALSGPTEGILEPSAVIEFFEHCTPPRTAHHAKRIIRIGKHARLADTPELQVATSFWDGLMLPHRPARPLEGPLFLVLEFTWPWNVGDSKRLRATGRTWHDKKPDAENLCKTVVDALGRCAYFLNDSQIVEVVLRKYRGERPGVRVRLVRGEEIKG